MVYSRVPRRKLIDDAEENEVLPMKGRPFTMKESKAEPPASLEKSLETIYEGTPEAETSPLTLNKSSFENTLGYKDAPAAKFQDDAISDQTGLERAMEQGDAYSYGDTLYVTGSHTAKDWFDDVTKIPFWGDVKNSTRYIEANKALKANPAITRVVGHSLGGSVALELQKNNPNLKSQTYGAPVFDPFGTDKNFKGTPDRYSNLGDPVSFFDGSAKLNIGNPFDSMNLTHGYNNIASKFTSGASQITGGYKNADGSISLTQ